VSSPDPEDTNYVPLLYDLSAGGRYTAINGRLVDWVHGLVLGGVLRLLGLSRYDLFLLTPRTPLLKRLSRKRTLAEALFAFFFAKLHSCRGNCLSMCFTGMVFFTERMAFLIEPMAHHTVARSVVFRFYLKT
jgi:hypothetical protein